MKVVKLGEKEKAQLPLYQTLSMQAIVPKMADKLKPGGGWYIDAEDKKIKARGLLDPFRPWIYVYPENKLEDRNCIFFRDIMWLRFKLFPSYCRNLCHKTVVRPRTVVELVRLYDLMVDLDLESKLGTEKRGMVPHQYGAYFYSESLERALEIKQILQKQVGKRVGHKIDITVKRGCTEMELVHGPSDEWQPLSAYEQQREDQLLSVIEPPTATFDQPEWLKNDIMLSWFDHAWENGDLTVLQFTGNEPLYKPCVTY